SNGKCRRRCTASSDASLPLRTSSKILRMASAFNGAPYEYYSVGRLQCGDATRLVLISETAHKLRYFSRRLRRELFERLVFYGQVDGKLLSPRSEERRVGKECISGVSQYVVVERVMM